MRAAQIQNNTVINYAEVGGFDGATFIAPGNSVLGSTWNGLIFTPPPPAPIIIPQQITMCQARLALLGAGLLASVNSAVAGLSGPTAAAAQIEWEYSAIVQRNDALVSSVSASLGLSSAQLDALFVAGAAL